MNIESMKYDFDLDLVHNNSLSLIHDQINKDSVVLEFGPANGRMTKYLKEVLNCKVYLVEIDEMAGKEALQYAEDLVVGDAEDFEWLEKYRDIRFDYITFADVLEHLRDPEQVLVQAKHLLKFDGTILLSVPNLAHNSVLIDLYNNKFEYNSVGLLDNTHIHMFTKESLESMIQRTDLYVETRMATYLPVGACEIVNSVNDVSYMDRSYWDAREYGEVYQFVYSLKLGREYLTKQQDLIPTHRVGYYAQLNKFGAHKENNSEKLYVRDLYGINTFVFTKLGNERRYEFSPLNTSCIVEIGKLIARSKDAEIGVKIISSNAELANNGMFIFYTDNPVIQIEVMGEEEIEQLEIIVGFKSIDTKQIRQVVDATRQAAYVFKTSDEYIEDNKKTREKLVDERITDMNNQMEIERKDISRIKEELNQEIEKSHQKIEELYQDIEELKVQKIELEDARNQIGEMYEQMKGAYEQKDQLLEQLYTSRSWRYTKFLRRS